MLGVDEDDGRKSEVVWSVGTDEDVVRARAVRNDPVWGAIRFVVEGITVGGGIATEARDPGGMASMLLVELLRSVTTDDCREELDVPLGFGVGLNTGPPFSVNFWWAGGAGQDWSTYGREWT